MEILKNKRPAIAFFGTPAFALPILEACEHLPLHIACIVSQPSRKRIGGVTVDPPVIAWAKEHGKIFRQFSNLRDEQVMEFLRSLQLNAIILAAYGSIVPSNLLTIPKVGWVNIHPSLLPKYRGASPIQQVIRDDEKTTGVSLIQMDAGIDTGNLYVGKSCDIRPDDTFTTLQNRLSHIAAQLVTEHILPIIRGEYTSVPQKTDAMPVTQQITKEDGHIDWNEEAGQIEKMIRAYLEWPSAYTIINNIRIQIHSAEIVSTPDPIPRPGAITIFNGNLIVGCGKSTALRILSCRREGKKTMDATSFLHGFPGIDRLQCS